MAPLPALYPNTFRIPAYQADTLPQGRVITWGLPRKVTWGDILWYSSMSGRYISVHSDVCLLLAWCSSSFRFFLLVSKNGVSVIYYTTDLLYLFLSVFPLPWDGPHPGCQRCGRPPQAHRTEHAKITTTVNVWGNWNPKIIHNLKVHTLLACN